MIPYYTSSTQSLSLHLAVLFPCSLQLYAHIITGYASTECHDTNILSPQFLDERALDRSFSGPLRHVPTSVAAVFAAVDPRIAIAARGEFCRTSMGAYAIAASRNDSDLDSSLRLLRLRPTAPTRPRRAGMLMHAPPCVPDCNLALPYSRISLPSRCWQGVGQDTADARVPSDQCPVARHRNQQFAHRPARS